MSNPLEEVIGISIKPEAPEKGYKSRLLSNILLSLLFLVFLIISVFVFVDFEEPVLTIYDLYVTVVLFFLLLAAYLLNRRGHYLIGAGVLVSTLSIVIFIATGVVLKGFSPHYDSGDVGLLVFLIFPLLISGMLLSLRRTIITAVLIVVGMLIIPAYFSHITFADIIMGPFLLFIIVATLVSWTKYHRDIIEKLKKVELMRSKEKYRLLVETLNEGIWQIDEKGCTEFVNRRMAEMLGYEVEEMVGEHLYSFVDDRWKKEAEKKLKKRRHGVTEQHKFIFRKKNGELIYTMVNTSPIFDCDGNYEGAVAGVTDITERRRAEKRSIVANRRLQYLLSSTSVVLYSARPYGDYAATFLSENVKKMTGYSPEKFLEDSDFWIKHIHPDDRYKVEKEVPLIFEKKVHTYEYRFRCEDGNYIWVRDEMKLVRDEDGEPLEIIGYWLDISERKKMEEELLKVEKLESLGVLAGGIAHDFNNLLTGIMGNVSLAKVKADDDIREMLEDVEEASKRAKKLTDQLLTFSKGGEPVREKASIEEIIRESAEFILSGSNVKCVYNFPDNLRKVNVDEGQMSQVINNLILNADQAMPEGGDIEISAENITLGEDNSLNLEEGNYVKVTISDEGTGISEEHQKKIFDPYFSTKSMGSGLGLATVYSIIKKHSGYIDLDSELGEGTSFYFFLPAFE